jgi:hypothetical protein
MRGFSERYRAFDRFQEEHGWLGFPLAVLQKYSDDQGAYLAASIAYYGFFAVFPLLLVLTTVLGFLLQGHPHLEHRRSTRTRAARTCARSAVQETTRFAGVYARRPAMASIELLQWGLLYSRPAGSGNHDTSGEHRAWWATGSSSGYL